MYSLISKLHLAAINGPSVSPQTALNNLQITSAMLIKQSCGNIAHCFMWVMMCHVKSSQTNAHKPKHSGLSHANAWQWCTWQFSVPGQKS